MSKRIELKLDRTHPHVPQGIWIAYHFDDGPEDRIVDLFDTHAIPTAFTGDMSGGHVQRIIEDLNPDYEVVLG